MITVSAYQRIGIMVLGLVFWLSPSYALIRLSSFYTDGMVLQRDKPIRIKGQADVGEVVSILWQNCTTVAHPDAKGNWEATLPPTPAGGPYTLELFGKEPLKIRNVLVGEVILIAGDETLAQSVEAAGLSQVLDRVPDASLRICQINQLEASFAQRNASQAQIWATANEFNVLKFSAIGIWYASEIRRYAQVPVGIIQATWPATAIESWLSPEAAIGVEELKLRTEELRRMGQDPGDFLAAKRISIRNRFEAYLQHQLSIGKPIYTPKAWLSCPNLTRAWQTVYLPGDLRLHPRFVNHPLIKGQTGIYYLSRQIALPKRLRHQKQYVFSLGDLQSLDSVWVNGQLIGTLPATWKGARRYTFNAPNRIDTLSVLIRIDHQVNAPLGYQSSEENFCLTAAGESYLLRGGWYMMQGLDYQSTFAPALSHVPSDPTTLFNGMIAPLTSLAIGQVVWSQGAANRQRGWQYSYLFPALITGWRQAWGDKELPFFFLQSGQRELFRVNSQVAHWHELRAAQASALSLPRVGMVCLIDDSTDTESGTNLPSQLAGQRLLGLYRQVILDEKIKAAGPQVAKKPMVNNQKIVIQFDEPLFIAGGKVTAFSIAGSDGKYFPAELTLEGRKLTLSSAAVALPLTVRYAWEALPKGGLVYGKSSGLPLAPLRTDVFPWATYMKTKDTR